MTATTTRIRFSNAAGTVLPRLNNWVAVCAEESSESSYKRLLHTQSCDVHVVHDAADLKEPGLLGVVFDDGLRGWRRDALVSMVATGVPIVVGYRAPRSTQQFAWEIKPGIEAAGGIFEISTDASDFKCRLNSVVRAALLRSHQQEAIAQALLGLASGIVLDAAWGPSSPHGILQFWQTLRTHLERNRAAPALSELPGVKASTNDLRNQNSGRLDGELIRACFGLKRTELANLLDVTPEALRQTPDSPNHRERFEVLEQIAALRTLLANPADFAKWLESPNTELEGETPIALIRAGRATVVADLVQDILTNRGG
jgi:hypothetical protein